MTAKGVSLTIRAALTPTGIVAGHVGAVNVMAVCIAVVIVLAMISAVPEPRPWVEVELEKDRKLVEDIVADWMADRIEQPTLEKRIDTRMRSGRRRGTGSPNV